MKIKQFKLSKARTLKALKKPVKKALQMALRFGVKLKRKGVRKLIVQTLSFVKFHLSIRPRAGLILRAIPTLAVAFILASQAVAYLEPKKAEIKINGQNILVADKTDKLAEDEIEVSYNVASKRSPFDFKYPVNGHLTQGYRAYHPAYDIATALGSPIRPLGAGRVEFAGSVTGGKGNIVIVDHGDGLKSLYAHMGNIYVGVGNEVNPEMSLGTVGMTGRTTGPHVHLEIYDKDVAVNPGSILPEAN